MKKIISKTIMFILVLGFGSYIAIKDLYIGIVVNFLDLVIIGYFLSANLTKTIVLPCGLEYIFLLTQPVDNIQDLYRRILALLCSPILIMIAQFIVHKGKNKVEINKSEILEFEKTKDPVSEIKLFGNIIKIHKIRMAYALRLGGLISILTFLNEKFLVTNGIIEGKWIIYTIFSLTELYAEKCKIKSKKRIQGTLIGTTIVIVLFFFIKSTVLRGIIILLSGYLNSFCEEYRDMIIWTTVSAVASVAISKGSLLIGFERILFVSIGIVISLIGNRFLFRVKEVDML